jgi:hypothetical protein
MTPEEVENLRKLTDEFKDELKSLGASVKDINNRLDALSRSVADINKRLDHMIHWSANLFIGERTDQSRYNFVDYSGAYRAASNTLFGSANVLHDILLDAKGNLGNGIKANIGLDIGNYEAYRGYTYSQGAAASPALNNTTGAAQGMETITPYIANVEIPLGGEKSNTTLTVGRYGQQVTALTYQRPNLDAYFDVPWLNDGNYIQDGIKLKSKAGSVDAQLWLASLGSVVDSQGNAINQPLFGSIYNRALGGFPAGINVYNDQLPAEQAMGLGLGIPVFKFGQLGFNIIYLSTNSLALAYSNVSGAYQDEVVYDATFKLKPMGRFTASAEWAKSVTQQSITQSDGQPNDRNNAYTATAGYASGPINAKIGYTYIDPNFSAPGAWEKLGNWFNPTNLQGPFIDLGYTFNKSIQVHLRDEFWTVARNPVGGSDSGGLQIGNSVDRATAGICYKLNKCLGLTADYEGDFFNTGSAGGGNPLEQYVTLGVHANLSPNAVLKLAYEMQNINLGTGSSAFSALDAGNNGWTSNANVLTTQLSVHF